PAPYPLSLHDALPISRASSTGGLPSALGRDDGRGLTEQVDLAAHGPGEVRVEVGVVRVGRERPAGVRDGPIDEREVALENAHGRSEEHTSELQSRSDL